VSTVLVYVHGLWQRGAESFWLRRRLARALDAKTRVFTYPSVLADVASNAGALAQYLKSIRADTLHLLGHSLGGVIIVKCFELAASAALPPGRIVLLGSPLQGSRTARHLARWSWGRTIMGRSVVGDLLPARRRQWAGTREVGIIAGDSGIGLGRLIGTLGGPSDGTVLVDETRLPGAKDHTVLRASHTGMLFSAAVAKQAQEFFIRGHFKR
jgi:pimeloyl-ACP methyl ester carboxylesterase